MFRAGMLRRCGASVATKGACPSLQRQRRYIQSKSYQQHGLATRSMGTPSATAQILGSGKQQQASQRQAVAKDDSGSEGVSTLPDWLA